MVEGDEGAVSPGPGAQHLGGRVGRVRRRIATAVNDSTRVKASRSRIVASAPGQRAPAPSVDRAFHGSHRFIISWSPCRQLAERLSVTYQPLTDQLPATYQPLTDQ